VKPKAQVTVQNPVAGTSTGTQRVRIVGIDGRLIVSVAVAYFALKGRPGAFGANTFKLYGAVTNEAGQYARLSDTPLNGSSGQNAPDGWEGRTLLPAIDVEHAYAGLGAGSEGHWEVLVYASPAASDMCQADFDALWALVDIQLVDQPVTVT
jgi:hypothetical protein